MKNFIFLIVLIVLGVVGYSGVKNFTSPRNVNENSEIATSSIPQGNPSIKNEPSQKQPMNDEDINKKTTTEVPKYPDTTQKDALDTDTSLEEDIRLTKTGPVILCYVIDFPEKLSLIQPSYYRSSLQVILDDQTQRGMVAKNCENFKKNIPNIYQDVEWALTSDEDGDGLTKILEHYYYTSDHKKDSDNDGVNDFQATDQAMKEF